MEEQKIESSQIAGWLGLNSKEMWDTFLPELDQRYKDQASKSPFVGCLYGYGEEGELDRADYLVENIEEILTKAGI